MSKKILVVDDEPQIVEVIQARLQAQGYDVITGANGQEALTKARSEMPDLIVLDLMLPKMDGYRVGRLLKLDELYKHIPILILSARMESEYQELGLEGGADAFLSKPFDAEEFVAKIRELLKES